MPNPFDQFDQQAAAVNPFDRFDSAPAPQTAPVQAAAPSGSGFVADPDMAIAQQGSGYIAPAFWKDAATIPGEVWKGAKAVAGGVGHAIANPSEIPGDVADIAKGVAGGLWDAGKKVVTDPSGAAQDVENYTTQHPARVALNLLAASPEASAVVGRGIGTVASPLTRAITPLPAEAARAAAVKALQDAGVAVSAGNRTGNETLRTAEDYVAKLPFGTLLSKNPSAGSMRQVTQAAAAKAGLPAAEVPTHDVLEQGFETVGKKIGSIQNQYPIPTTEILPAAAQIADDIPIIPSDGKQKAAHYFLNRIINGPELSPEAAQATRTQLNTAIRGENGPSGTPAYKDILIQIKGALDNGLAQTIQKSGNPTHLAELQQARQQYANLHTLSDALYASGPKGQLGQLTPGALQTALARSVGKTGYMKGRGDLNALASASKAILPQVPDSYTATREGILNPLKWALSLPAQLAINSRPAQAYLGNQLIPRGASAAIAQPALPAVTGLLDTRTQNRGLLSP